MKTKGNSVLPLVVFALKVDIHYLPAEKFPTNSILRSKYQLSTLMLVRRFSSDLFARDLGSLEGTAIALRDKGSFRSRASHLAVLEKPGGEVFT
jgi:hypothetical protein